MALRLLIVAAAAGSSVSQTLIPSSLPSQAPSNFPSLDNLTDSPTPSSSTPTTPYSSIPTQMPTPMPTNTPVQALPSRITYQQAMNETAPANIRSAGAEPKPGDPYAKIAGNGTVLVTVRGINQEFAGEPLMLWLVDGDGEVVCEQYVTTAPPQLECNLGQVGTVMSVQYGPDYGVYVGPRLNVAHERAASSAEESVSGTITRVIDGPLQYHEPYLTIDRSTMSGRLVVLGPNGSTNEAHPQNPSHFISAVWVRDQHDTVLAFYDLSQSSERANVSVYFSAASPAATVLTPYSIGNQHDLWQGRDPLNFESTLATSDVITLGSLPRQYEPYVKIHSNRTAEVVLRGSGGSIADREVMTQSDFTNSLVLVDQNGDVVCQRLMDGTEGYAELHCALPESVSFVRAYRSTSSSVIEGALLNVAAEVYASGIEETVSPGGVGPAASVIASATPQPWDPVTSYDPDTMMGSIAVLGVNGTNPAEPGHTVQTIWARDQHDTIKIFENVPADRAAVISFNLNDSQPEVYSLIPFMYDNIHGMHRGLDALGFKALRDAAVLNKRTPSGGSTPDGRYVVGDVPVKHDPFITISPNRTATVVVRGTNGSTTTLHPQSRSHFIRNIWITDLDGNVLCEKIFSGYEPEPSMSCVLPHWATLVQAHEYCNLHGLWSGEVINVEYEVYVSDRLENATATDAYFPASASAVEYEPRVLFNADSKLGYGVVLGQGGSMIALAPQNYPDQYVEAFWAINQHGAVVHLSMFDEYAVQAITFVDLRSRVTNSTSLFPYQFTPSMGVFAGQDSFTISEPNFGTSTSTPHSADTCTGASGEDDSSSVDDGVIAAMVLAALLVVVIIAFTVVVWRRHRDKNTAPNTTMEGDVDLNLIPAREIAENPVYMQDNLYGTGNDDDYRSQPAVVAADPVQQGVYMEVEEKGDDAAAVASDTTSVEPSAIEPAQDVDSSGQVEPAQDVDSSGQVEPAQDVHSSGQVEIETFDSFDDLWQTDSANPTEESAAALHL